MSLVTVHGPNTMYTTESGGVQTPSSPVGAVATKSPTNGLVFTFSFPNPGANPATAFDWTFTGPGSPVAQPNVFGGTVTFTGPGAVTIVCTVNGATPPPANQAYTVSATATSGTPRLAREAVAEPDMSQPALKPEEQGEEWDPGDYTVADVLAWAEDHPDEIPGILEAEVAGRNRVTLVTQLEEMQE